VTVILCSTSGCGDPAVESGFGRCSFHSARSNRIEFMGRTYTRRPVGSQKIAVVLMCWGAMSLFFADISPPSGGTPAPVKAPAGANGWPAGTSAWKMCRSDNGVEQVLPVGGATAANPLPGGSQVACTDGSIQNVRLNP
jgi:hypothetical protein